MKNVKENIQLWKINEEKAKKNGVHKTIYWVKKNKQIFSQAKTFKVSQKYKGNWENNQKSGFGIQIYHNGNRYEGEFENNMRNGRGTLWIMNNRKKLIRQYTGQWKDNMKWGEGTMFFDNGDRYDGFWEENKMSGYGRMVQSNKDVYIGQWFLGKRNGYGFLTKNNGDNFEGYWIDNLKEGPGSYFFAQQKKIIVGEWTNDSPKTAIYSDVLENDNSKILLPNLMLENLQSLINDLFLKVKLERLIYRIQNMQIEALISKEIFNEINNQWQQWEDQQEKIDKEFIMEQMNMMEIIFDENQIDQIWEEFKFEQYLDIDQFIRLTHYLKELQSINNFLNENNKQLLLQNYLIKKCKII